MSSPYLNKNESQSNLNNNYIEKSKGSQLLPFERQDDFNYSSQPENNDLNKKLHIKFESNSGSNCCTEYEKKCLIF